MDALPIGDVLIHIRDSLATDGRVGELGLDVVCEEDVIVVRGAISNETRQSGICPVVLEVLRAYGEVYEVRDDTHVPSASAPDREPEQL